MNERVPDSSGLPLRAMVMVLLFLGVIFLLVALQALGSDDSGDDAPSVATTTTTSAAATTSASASEEPAAKADVLVFNIGEVAGAADRTATQLREAGWNVADTGNREIPGVAATTVYFGDADGEQASAEEVGKVLNAPVERRTPEIANEPPGVVVLVTG